MLYMLNNYKREKISCKNQKPKYGIFQTLMNQKDTLSNSGRAFLSWLIQLSSKLRKASGASGRISFKLGFKRPHPTINKILK